MKTSSLHSASAPTSVAVAISTRSSVHTPLTRLMLFALMAGIILFFVSYPAPLPVSAQSPLPAEASQSLSLYVPLVKTGPRAPAKDVGSSDGAVCALNEKEAAVAALMASHPDQRRASLTCDPILASVARQRAEDMARRAYFDHITPEGYGPNYLVRQAGYNLPSWYDQSPDANNLESIAAGYDTPDEAFTAWMESEFHRIHLLGHNEFYADQVMYGIGYFYLEESPYGYYWVVLTAPEPE